MIQEKLGEILPKDAINPPVVLALACSSAAAVVIWKWMTHRGIQRKMDEARRWRDDSLEQMEKVIWKFKQKVSGCTGVGGERKKSFLCGVFLKYSLTQVLFMS